MAKVRRSSFIAKKQKAKEREDTDAEEVVLPTSFEEPGNGVAASSIR